METIIAYILGVLTVFLLGMAVGMFMVMRKTQSLQKETESINVELLNTSRDLYRLIEKERNEIDQTFQTVYREIERNRDEFNRLLDSRFNKMENKLTQTDSKTLLKG